MRKPILSLITFLLLSNVIFAANIDVNYAMQVAVNFYHQTTGKTVRLALAYQSLNTVATNNLALGEPLYYAFNVEGAKGFVIISADDLVKPVLGYSTDQSFKIQNAPPVITGWLNKYSRQIAYAKVNRIPATLEITTQWNTYYNNLPVSGNHLKSAVSPLLTTTWDQDLYYNAMCPQDPSSPNGYGGNVPTGCGATAMSQIMRYWSYPAQGTGTNSYNSNYGTLSANFGATTYNWANMPNSLGGPNTAVATIMYDCGVAVDMTYQADESLSYILTADNPISCQNAYTTYFGYDPNTIQGLRKSDYANETTWTNLIQTELNASRPVQYAGQGPQGGHTFVLDGSDGQGNFHFNWGWSGDDNGYYGIDALIPGPDANGDFSQAESMVIGIQPLNVTVVTSGINLYAAVTVTPNPIGFLQTFAVTTNLVNTGSSSFNGSYCAALFDASGNFIRYIGDILSTTGNPLLAGNHYTNGLTFNDTSQAITAPGTYSIGIYYQPTGVNTWTLAGASTYTNPISVTIGGPSDNIALYSNITVSPGTFTQGQPASVNVNLVNNGNSTYLGQYEAVLLDLEGNLIETIGVLNETTGLPANDYYLSPYLTFNTNSITAPEGQYILAIAENQTGVNTWYYCGGQTYQNPVLVDVVNNGFQVSVNETPANQLKIYPNPASNNVTIDAGNAHGDYSLKIYNTVGQVMSESNGVLNGQSLTSDVSAFAAGMYVIELKTESGILNAKVVVK